MFQSTELNRVGDLENILILRREMQSLESTLLVFNFALFQYFFTMLPFFYFGIVIYILCHCILQVCHLLFISHGINVRDCLVFQKILWTFNVGTVLGLCFTMRNFEVGIKALCITIWLQAMRVREWNVVF